jgi:hypothetical protein
MGLFIEVNVNRQERRRNGEHLKHRNGDKLDVMTEKMNENFEIFEKAWIATQQMAKLAGKATLYLGVDEIPQKYIKSEDRPDGFVCADIAGERKFVVPVCEFERETEDVSNLPSIDEIATRIVEQSESQNREVLGKLVEKANNN